MRILSSFYNRCTAPGKSDFLIDLLMQWSSSWYPLDLHWRNSPIQFPQQLLLRWRQFLLAPVGLLEPGNNLVVLSPWRLSGVTHSILWESKKGVRTFAVLTNSLWSRRIAKTFFTQMLFLLLTKMQNEFHLFPSLHC